MKVLGVVVALMVSQNSALPGPDDATFEQRWQNMIVKQILRKQVDEIMTEEPKKAVAKKEEKRPEVAHRRHVRRATGCRYGHKVYHGKSWRCGR